MCSVEKSKTRMSENLIVKLKTLNERYSDVSIRIIEKDTQKGLELAAVNEGVHEEGDEVTVEVIKKKNKDGSCSSMKAHKVILDMSSDRLSQFFHEYPFTSVCEVRVPVGKASHVKQLLYSFYDIEILDRINKKELIGVLEVATQLQCQIHVERCIDIFSGIKDISLEEYYKLHPILSNCQV